MTLDLKKIEFVKMLTLGLSLIMLLTTSCISDKKEQETDTATDTTATFDYKVDQFADVKVLRYLIPGWEQLTLKEQKLVYYLTQAGLSGRDIMWDQNYRHNLLAFIRYNKYYTELMVYLINLSKECFNDFRIGVPFRGKYCKVIDTDAQEFGGNGHNWISDYHTDHIPSFHHQYSFTTKLLPLHGLLFKSLDIKR